MDSLDKVLRVSGRTSVHSLATAIAGALAEGRLPVLRFIGAAAGNQSIKACAIASSYAAQRGSTLKLCVEFDNAQVSDSSEPYSCIVIRVEEFIGAA